MQNGTDVGAVVGTDVGSVVGCPVGSPLGAPVAWSFRARSADPSNVTSTAVWALLRTTAANNITTRRPKLRPAMMMCPHPSPPARARGAASWALRQVPADCSEPDSGRGLVTSPGLVVVGDQMDI